MPQLYPDQSQTQSLSPTGQPVTQSPSPAPPKQQQDGLGTHDPIVTLTQSMLTMAQTIGTMASPLERSAKDLEARWQMNEILRRELDKQSDRLRKLSEELEKKEQKLVEREENVQQREKVAENKHNEAAERLKKAEEVENKNKQDEERIKPLLDQEKTINEEKAAAEKARQDAENERKAADDYKKVAEAAKAETQEYKQAIEEFETQHWPSSLRGGDWDEWRKRLVEDAKSRPDAALLVVAFHRFCASDKTTDDQELQDALQELGQRLYKYYKSQDNENQDVIRRIANALSSSSNGKFCLVVVTPGHPPNEQLMNYQPGLATVKEVRNWAIRYQTSPGGTMQLVRKADVL